MYVSVIKLGTGSTVQITLSGEMLKACSTKTAFHLRVYWIMTCYTCRHDWIQSLFVRRQTKTVFMFIYKIAYLTQVAYKPYSLAMDACCSQKDCHLWKQTPSLTTQYTNLYLHSGMWTKCENNSRVLSLKLSFSLKRMRYPSWHKLVFHWLPHSKFSSYFHWVTSLPAITITMIPSGLLLILQ